jgi:hypothetical protein
MWAKIKEWLTTHSDFMNSVTFLAAMAHVGWACLIILSTALISSSNMHWCIGVSAFMFVFAAIKEFWYDMMFERPKQTWLDGIGDFVGYLSGIALAWVVMSITLCLHSQSTPHVTPVSPASADNAAWILTNKDENYDLSDDRFWAREYYYIEERAFCAKYNQDFVIVRDIPDAPKGCLKWLK